MISYGGTNVSSPAPNVPAWTNGKWATSRKLSATNAALALVTDGGSQAPTKSRSSASGSSNRSTSGSSGAIQTSPQRSCTAKGLGVTSRFSATVQVRPRSVASTGSSLTSATGCQARCSSASTLDDNSTGSSPVSGFCTQTAPSSSLTGVPVRLARGGIDPASPSDGTVTQAPSGPNSQPW